MVISSSTMMQRILIFLTLIGFLYCGSIAQPQPKPQPKPHPPKLVVGIVVDQMRYDYLARFSQHFGDSGFNLMLKNGRSWSQMHYNYLPTFTGPGHASIYTGTTPSLHGIAANDWFDVSEMKEVYCVADPAVKPLGDEQADPMSPANLRVSTMGDQLKAANPTSKVYGLALKDRGGILPAGKMADGAFWFDSKSGTMISSTYYGKELQPWVLKFNQNHHADAYLKNDWNLCLSPEEFQSLPDDLPYEKSFKGEEKPIFPHKISDIKGKGFGILRNLPFGNTYTADFARALIEGEGLGKDDITDLLCVSFSSPDYIGHQFGTQSREVMDAYIRLDRDLANLFQYLDQKVGRDAYVMFLSSDHGAADHPYHLKDTCFYSMDYIVRDLKRDLLKTFGDTLILAETNDQLYIREEALAKSGMTTSALATWINHHLQGDPSFLGAVVPGDPSCSLPGTGCSHTLNGFDHQRSGQIWLHFRPGCLPEMFRKGGTTHGTCYHYDTHVPFLLMAPNLEPGKETNPAKITDIAPTICDILGIMHPSGCTGQSLLQK